MKFTAIFVLATLFVCAYSHPLEERVDSVQLEDINNKEYFILDTPLMELELNHHLRLKREPKKRRGSAEVSVNRDRQGTDVNARVNARIWESKNGRSELNGEANYNRHFGGSAGSSRPNYGAGLNFVHRF